MIDVKSRAFFWRSGPVSTVIKIALLICLISVAISCVPPEGVPVAEQAAALENQISMDGTVYTITAAYIYYWGDERIIMLYFNDGQKIVPMHIHFLNQSTEIPTGEWLSFNADLREIWCTLDSGFYSFMVTDGAAISVSVSGVEGGNLTVNCTVDDESPEAHWAMNYSGPYTYITDY